jgi:hypothetical protein
MKPSFSPLLTEVMKIDDKRFLAMFGKRGPCRDLLHRPAAAFLTGRAVTPGPCGTGASSGPQGRQPAGAWATAGATGPCARLPLRGRAAVPGRDRAAWGTAWPPLPHFRTSFRLEKWTRIYPGDSTGTKVIFLTIPPPIHVCGLFVAAGGHETTLSLILGDIEIDGVTIPGGAPSSLLQRGRP